MPLFGGKRDVRFFHSINRELIQNIIEMELLLYKYDDEYSEKNVYGESLTKFYHEPVILNHIAVRNNQENSNNPYGVDNNRSHEFRFYKQHLLEAELYLEKGDIIEWNNEFYEVNNVVENQYFMGKSENSTIESHTKDFGYSISVIVNATSVRPDKLNIIDVGK